LVKRSAVRLHQFAHTPKRESVLRSPNSALHDFDLTQRRKGRKEQISLAFLASLRENRELLNLV
jgi:hypothetical protein